jgi:hypothetical protein
MMRRLLTLGLMLVGIAPTALAAESYEMLVTLDPDGHRLTGQQWIRWTNGSDTATNELWWHLYMNAFASPGSTFMRELGKGTLRRQGSRGDMEWGWVRVTKMALADGSDLLPSLTFERPDDGNSDDYTVARVVLPDEVPPGAAVEIETSFEVQLPTIIARTGFTGDFHLVGQWYPKLGVFEGQQGWNCHQFHANSEFFADFGSYRVTINVPSEWVVAATGMEITRMEVPNDPSRGLQVVYSADRVHDFAWTAAPESLMVEIEADFDPGRDVPLGWLDDASERLGLSPAELELPPARLKLLIPHSQLALKDRFLNGTRLGLAWYGLWYGPYPYPQLTVVSPPSSALEAGGMEYPTFITAGGSRLLMLPPLSWLSWPEAVTIHEFGHQYFQGILASNEFEQAWLDEGLNSYAEVACMEAAHAHGLVPHLPFGGYWAKERMSLGAMRSRFAIDQRAWDYRTRSQYFAASYTKTAVTLRTLEGLIGPQPFARAMRTYFERYRFSHPTGDDFFDTLSEVAGEDLGWFFDQAFRSDATPDFAVLSVRHRRSAVAGGYHWTGDEWEPSETFGDGVDDEDGPWDVRVDIGRRGEFTGPVEVELEWEDGSRERRRWDGMDRWVRWSEESSQRLVRVVVDPDGVWALETRRRDNYWSDDGSTRVVCRSLWWVAEVLQLIGLAPLPWS